MKFSMFVVCFVLGSLAQAQVIPGGKYIDCKSGEGYSVVLQNGNSPASRGQFLISFANPLITYQGGVPVQEHAQIGIASYNAGSRTFTAKTQSLDIQVFSRSTTSFLRQPVGTEVHFDLSRGVLYFEMNGQNYNSIRLTGFLCQLKTQVHGLSGRE